MKAKIFKAVWVVAISVCLASMLIILGISYSYFSSVQRRQLRNETELAAQGVMLAGEDYFINLNTDNYRITWISELGDVLYDNEADSAHMENHLEREEVRRALESGYGEASRYSDTLSDKQLYAAKRLPDGSVLRLSVVQTAVWTLLLGFAQPICLVILAALIFSFVLASRLSKRITKPINEIALDKPEAYYGKEEYKEIEPLLQHISQQQAQLKRDQAQIEKTALIRQEFTANVSHELKTPLHAISGYAELLEKGLVKSEDIKPFAGKIRSESMRMARLVEDTIDLSKLDSGGAELLWESCDLYKIAQNAIDSLDVSAAAAGVELYLEGGSTVLCAVPQLLYSIIYNLCDNAIKYNQQGGEVRVLLSQGEDNAVLRIKDNGVGIPKDSQDRVFERFYRVDKSRSKEVGGTGLGLSIVKHAVQNLHGKIELKSEPGVGSEFIVTLPNRAEQRG